MDQIYDSPDTLGTQLELTAIQEQLPAGHNPFHHFDRAIISIDTLKNASTWRPFLENSYWDIVVVDEVQNVARKKNQRGSLRHQLAEILAFRCDSLIMLSATPHDGHAESFASLINMLDPTVIADKSNYTKADLDGKHLLIRRFKKDIREQATLKKRKVHPHRAAASPKEERVFSIIADTHHEQLSKRTGDGWLLRTIMEKASSLLLSHVWNQYQIESRNSRRPGRARKTCILGT